VLKQDGPSGFYRGYFAYAAAYAPGAAVQWGSYELFKRIVFQGFTILESKSTQIPFGYKEHITNSLAGGLAATCSVCANNPLEIIRIRTQLLESASKKDAESLKGGYWKLAGTIFKEEGWRAFYRGLRIRLLVTVPSSMVALTGYETIKTWSAENKE
jgi:Mitochondrial carrier protein